MKRYAVILMRCFYAAGFAAMVCVAVSGRGATSYQTQDEEVAAIATPDPIRHEYPRPELCALVDSASNFIVDSTGSLRSFMEKLEALRRGDEVTVSILHVGDSHVQAGFLTGRLRELFQTDFGNAGRGLITPHRMARMNEASDYSISTPYGYKPSKITDRMDGRLGFTGVAITFETPFNELRIWSKDRFSAVTVFHSADAPVLYEPAELNIGSYCDIDNTPFSTRITLSRAVDSLTLSGFVTPDRDDPTFYGFSLENGNSGVIYHSVGINGAAFEHFLNNSTLPDGGAQPLNPDIIIISLGTNNCYGGNFRSELFYNCVDGFIRRMKDAYAGVPLLMTAPMESCRRQGRNRVPNRNVADATGVICAAAADNGAAYWNLYDAAGGGNAMERWYARGLANADRIHLTESGYRFQGDMLYEAFARYFNQFIDR